MELRENEVYFAKVNPKAIIPSKESENGGYDIYACFDGCEFTIQPHTTAMIPAGISSAFSEDYVIVLKERGSTGSKGIAQRCGVIDSGFRGEWKVPITNTTDKVLHISDEHKDSEFHGHYDIYYPKSKAICQAIVVPVPKINIKEISLEELKLILSKRGEGMLGSSNK